MITIPVYLRERSILAGRLPGAKFCVINVLGQAFEHYCDTDGYFKIDVTDFVRMQVAEPLIITYYNALGVIINTEQYVFNIVGYMTPEKMMPPAPATLLPPFNYFVINSNLFLPPSVVYCPFAESVSLFAMDVGAIGTITAFMHGKDSMGEDVYYEVQYDELGKCIYINMGDTMQGVLTIKSGFFEYFAYNVRFKDFPCGSQYACVERVNRFGVRVREFWEVEKRVEAQYDQYSLMDMQNAYDVRNGLEQSLTLVQRGLNAYDFWYYADIITSSDVRVTLQNGIYDLQESARVQVTTKKVTIPQGDAGATLKVEVNYRRYDAI